MRTKICRPPSVAQAAAGMVTERVISSLMALESVYIRRSAAVVLTADKTGHSSAGGSKAKLSLPLLLLIDMPSSAMVSLIPSFLSPTSSVRWCWCCGTLFGGKLSAALGDTGSWLCCLALLAGRLARRAFSESRADSVWSFTCWHTWRSWDSSWAISLELTVGWKNIDKNWCTSNFKTWF